MAEQDAVLHVVVGVGEGRLHDNLAQRGVLVELKAGEGFEQVVVDEVEQLVSSESASVFGVRRPAVPAKPVGDYGFVRIVVELPLLFLRIVDLQEEQPCHLLDTLSIAVDARVVAHDVLKGFHQGSQCHASSLSMPNRAHSQEFAPRR